MALDKDKRIDVGDDVYVNFNNAMFTLCHGKVVNVPCATGDSWVIAAVNGDLHYISEGCTITKEGELSND